MQESNLAERPPAIHAASQGDNLLRLVQSALNDAALQQSLATATSLSELVDRVRGAGFSTSVRELQLWSNHALLEADFWPWSRLTDEEKLLFFRKG